MDDQSKLLSGISSVKDNYLSGLRAIRRMWTFVSPWKLGFAVSVILGSTQPFVFPLILSWMLSRTMASIFAGDIRQLGQTLVYASLALLIPILLYPRCFYVLYSIFSKASGLARKRMFDHIQDLPVSYIEDRFSGDISSRMTTDLNDATQLFGYPTVGQYNPFSQVLSVAVLVVVLLCTNVPLGLFSILVSSLGLVVTGFLSDPIKQIERKTKETLGDATQDMVDMMAGSTMVRMYGMQKPLFRKYAEKTEHIRGLAMRSVKMRSTLGSAMELHLVLCYLVVVGIGLAMASKGLVSMPAVVFIATLQSGIGESMSYISRAFAGLQRYVAAADRVWEVLDASVEVNRPDRAAPDRGTGHAVEIRNLSFQYRAAAEPLFCDLNLNVKNGERLALVGSSGGGKSTLFKLLLDFEKPQAGEIRIFGHSIEEYGLETLRLQLAYVPQDSYLFDGSIQENIAWGRPGASREELEQAAKDAYLFDFIDALPDRFETRVGERGIQLSGGQRQRLAIARALLKDAPILLLDEATSSLDSESEQEVQQALERLMAGRTTLIIAHRLPTIYGADRILVVENGRIREAGTHTELLERSGRYAELYGLQFGALLG